MNVSRIVRLFRALRPSSARPTPPGRASRCPSIEPLEDRVVCSTVFVVPISQPTDATHTHSIATALPIAGADGIVIVEPGANPETAAVTITQSGITIQGEATIFAGSLPRFDVNINADNVTLDNLNLGNVTTAADADHATITRSQLMNFTETGAATGVGGNTLRHNLITGSITLSGNTTADEPTSDLIEHNSITTSTPVAIQLSNSNHTTIQDNHLLSAAANGIGIQVRSNSEQVVIAHNTVEMTGSTPYALVLINTGGAAGNKLSVQVLNNDLRTGGAGTGLYGNIFGTGSAFVVQVEGNILSANKLGVDVNGVPGATGAGSVDLGGGSTSFGSSRGVNDLRGFDGANGHYAINLHNTDAGITVFAQGNLFPNSVSPGTVVRDGNSGGGTGSLNVSAELDADHAFIQSLYLKLLGRAGDATAGGEVDQWVAKLPTLGRLRVASALLFSDESRGRMVNDLYATLLHREPNLTEFAQYTKLLKATKNIAAVETAILSSAERQTRLKTNFVQSLYVEILGRPATADEFAKSYRLPFKTLAARVTASKERRLDFANTVFDDLLHRTATADEAAALAKKPGPLLNLELSLLASDEFYNQG